MKANPILEHLQRFYWFLEKTAPQPSPPGPGARHRKRMQHAACSTLRLLLATFPPWFHQAEKEPERNAGLF